MKKNHFKLTQKQAEVMNLIAQGYVQKEVAHKMGIGHATVKTHVYNAILHNNCKTTSEVVYKAAKLNLI